MIVDTTPHLSLLYRETGSRGSLSGTRQGILQTWGAHQCHQLRVRQPGAAAAGLGQPGQACPVGRYHEDTGNYLRGTYWHSVCEEGN